MSVYFFIKYFNRFDKRGKMKKCIYCGCSLSEESLIDFCDSCGVSAFGEKMFKAIIQNIEEANKRGDLNQGVF